MADRPALREGVLFDLLSHGGLQVVGGYLGPRSLAPGVDNGDAELHSRGGDN